MKKICGVLMCLALLLGAFGGCAPQEEEPQVSQAPSPTPTAEPASPWQIGLVQYQENPCLDALREALMSRLEEWGCTEEQVEIDYQNAQGDPARAQEICQGFVRQEVDMVVALAAPAAQAAVEAAKGSQVQVVFAGVSSAGFLELEGKNATGVVSPVPVRELVDLARNGDSGLEVLGALYDPEDPAALEDVETLKAYCGELGLTVTEAKASQPEEVEKAAGELCATVDALFTPGAVAGEAAVAEAAKAAGVPWYAGCESMVQAGALAGLGVQNQETGRRAADMAVELIRGREMAEEPLYTFSESSAFLNLTTLESLEGIAVPQEVRLKALVYA